MVNFVEKLLQVDVYDPFASFLDILLGLLAPLVVLFDLV